MQITLGDNVVLIEVWPNAAGTLEPDTTTTDCRMYGVCTEVGEGYIMAAPDYDESVAGAQRFATVIDETTKQGDMIAFHQDAAPPVVSQPPPNNQ
jgi:hypothetical protein